MKRIVSVVLGVLMLFAVVSAQSGPGGPIFRGTLRILSNFAGGGPTIELQNLNAGGDVAIDFLSAGEFVGNMGVIRETEPNRFFVQQNASAVPLTLAEDGGNVGIGTNNPRSALQVVGYIQSDLTSGVPPSDDCDDAAERGRIVVDSAAGLLFVCVDSGWLAK
jgi:hypothetical protein